MLKLMKQETLLQAVPHTLLFSVHGNRSKFSDLTLFSPSGAKGSVIHEPNRDPDVLTVIGSLIAVSFPQAAKQLDTRHY